MAVDVQGPARPLESYRLGRLPQLVAQPDLEKCLMARKWTEKSDMAADKRAGIKQGSKKDNALDRKRGVPHRRGARGQQAQPARRGRGQGQEAAAVAEEEG